MTADDLYIWLKYALKHFGLSWNEKDKVEIELTHNHISAIFENERIILKDDD